MPAHTAISMKVYSMKKLFHHSFFFVLGCLLLALCSSCDDSTDMLGVDIMPTTDFVTKESKTYDVTTASYAVGDHVLARTLKSYFGRFTDPETETVVESDFLAQLCVVHLCVLLS